MIAPCSFIGALLLLIWRRTSVVPQWDEWELVNFFELADEGRLQLGNFWQFQNEHRIVLPRLILYGLITATGWDRQVIMTINLGLACATAALVAEAVRRTIGPRGGAVLLVPLVALLFSFAQFENWLFAFQTNFILAALGVACCLAGLLPAPAGRREGRGFALALAGAIVASLSTLGGLLAWAAFFPATWRLGPRRAALWLAAALGIAIPYASGFPGRAGDGAATGDLIGYGLAYLGAPLGDPSVGLATAYGTLGLALLAGALVAYRHLGGGWPAVAAWLGLALFALANAALTTLGRAGMGREQAITSRYQIFSTGWWVALLVVGWLAAARWRAAPRRSVAPPVALGGGAICLAFLATGLIRANVSGLVEGWAWQEPQVRHEYCIREYDTAEADCLQRFYVSAPLVRIHSAFLEQHRLGPFRAGPPSDFARLAAGGDAMATIDEVEGTDPARSPIVGTPDRPIRVLGWAIDRAAGGPAGAVYLLIDGRSTYRAEYGAMRPDVATATSLPGARRVGFVATLPPGMLAPGTHHLAVRIVADDGRSYSDSPQAVTVTVR